MNQNNAALLLIDIQKGFEQEDFWGGNRNHPELESNVEELLTLWRKTTKPVIHIRHASKNPSSLLHPDQAGFAFMDFIQILPSEKEIIKEVNSAFIGTDLDEYLKENNIHTLIMCGLTSNHCVSTTARMGGNMGYQVLLIEDAIATFNRKGLDGEIFDSELMHQTAMASLHEEFAQVISSQELISRFQLK